jgi:hypothetical protein
MWIPQVIRSGPAKLNFSSTGQNDQPVTQIYADDVMIANAVQLTDWDTERIQVLVCEACGIVHCEPGNWVTVRGAGNAAPLRCPSNGMMSCER